MTDLTSDSGPGPHTDEDVCERVIALIEGGEEWLMERILHYALEQGYTAYTSTLICAWRLSISGLSEALVASLRDTGLRPQEFHPKDDLAASPLARFAIEEAAVHRGRGIDLGMFLGLLKYYRAAYLDLVDEAFDFGPRLRSIRWVIHRCFDLFEIALTTEWGRTPADAVISDLSERNRSITNEKNFYLTAFESLIDPAFLIDRQGCIINLNTAAQALLSGRSVSAGELYYRLQNRDAHATSAPAPEARSADTDDPIGRDIAAVLPALEEALAHLDAVEETVHFECELLLRGRVHHFLLSQSRMLDVSGKYSGFVLFLTDISARRAREDELRRLSEHDHLTGLANRRHLEQAAQREVERARRTGEPLSVLSLDLDHFKATNDRFGHAAGDAVLVEVAAICTRLTRPYDIVARTGGEEFVILLPRTGCSAAHAMAERLRAALEQECRLIDGNEVGITASIGIAQLGADGTEFATLAGAADRAMYEAKSAGRNCIRAAPASVSATAH